jgi:hypothetical protein
VNLPRPTVSILNVIASAMWATSQPQMHCTGLHSLHPSTDHEKCNPVANWISLKTELETENRVTQFEGNAEFWGDERGNLPDAVFVCLELFDLHI